MADSPGVRRPTLADVARHAGVSTASVSYALNGQPGISEETRAMILGIARSLGFRPNRLARALRSGRSHVIGLLLGDITNPFYSELAAGVIRGAEALGHETFVSDTHEGHHSLTNAVHALFDHRCDGLIFTSLTEEDRPILEELARTGTPFVQLVRHVPDLAADFVGVDDAAGGRLAAEHVLARGCRDVALLPGPQASSASRYRLHGVRQALEAAGVVIRPEDSVECALTYDAGYAGTTTLLSSNTVPPDAIICGNDMIALGAIDAIIGKGWRVPEDVAVVGYDDMSFSSLGLIQLTTVAVPREQMGATAVQLLVERLSDPSMKPRRTLLPHRLVVRRTSLWARSDAEPVDRNNILKKEVR